MQDAIFKHKMVDSIIGSAGSQFNSKRETFLFSFIFLTSPILCNQQKWTPSVEQLTPFTHSWKPKLRKINLQLKRELYLQFVNRPPTFSRNRNVLLNHRLHPIAIPYISILNTCNWRLNHRSLQILQTLD